MVKIILLDVKDLPRSLYQSRNPELDYIRSKVAKKDCYAELQPHVLFVNNGCREKADKDVRNGSGHDGTV